MGRNGEIKARVGLVSDRVIEPGQMVPTRRLLGWMGEALLRGRFDVLREFFALGKQLGREKRHMAEARAQLEAATARLRDQTTVAATNPIAPVMASATAG